MAKVALPTTQADLQTIRRIARRYVKSMYRLTKNDPDAFVMPVGSAEACLLAVHEAEGPLDLAKLETFPDQDFLHDVGGILRFAEYPSGKLTRSFWPRCGDRK